MIIKLQNNTKSNLNNLNEKKNLGLVEPCSNVADGTMVGPINSPFIKYERNLNI